MDGAKACLKHQGQEMQQYIQVDKLFWLDII